METKKKEVYYVTYDNVKVFDGDNFYFLVSDIINDKVIHTIKFWNCDVMESFSENDFYLKDKTLFSNKTVLEKYIIDNKLVVSNFDLIFVNNMKVEIDRMADWDSEPHFYDENHNGKKFGIYTHNVNIEDVDTDWMFDDAIIVNVQWFETEKEQIANFREYAKR